MVKTVLGSGSMSRHVVGHLAMGDKIRDKPNARIYQVIANDSITIQNQDHIEAANLNVLAKNISD